MIEKTYALSDDGTYKRFNHFEISEQLKDILADDYYLYNTSEFKKENLLDDLYKINFLDKYDRETQKEIFEQYIDNEQFIKKTKFVYSVIDYEKYAKFVLSNAELEKPNDFTIQYSKFKV